MKKELLFLLFAVAFLSANFMIENETSKDVSLLNVTLMQANAGEMFCSRTNDVKCEITSGNEIKKETGYLIANW
jgi:hypothetical protein